MINFSRAGFVKTRKHPSAVVSGQPVAIGARAGVATGTYAADEEGEYLQGGVVKFKKSCWCSYVTR